MQLAPERKTARGLAGGLGAGWWRRRGIEPLVQRKTHPGFYRLSRLLSLARRTAGGRVTDGQSRLSFASVIGVRKQHPDIASLPRRPAG